VHNRPARQNSRQLCFFWQCLDALYAADNGDLEPLTELWASRLAEAL
jgi:predicted chitinase